jgi:hypothetical protein
MVSFKYLMIVVTLNFGRATLFKVCTLDAIQQFIMVMDLSTYQYVINILFPCFSKRMPGESLIYMRLSCTFSF